MYLTLCLNFSLFLNSILDVISFTFSFSNLYSCSFYIGTYSNTFFFELITALLAEFDAFKTWLASEKFICSFFGLYMLYPAFIKGGIFISIESIRLFPLLFFFWPLYPLIFFCDNFLLLIFGVDPVTYKAFSPVWVSWDYSAIT